MNAKDIKHFSRKELIELLLDYKREIERLNDVVRERDEQISQRQFVIENSESLAEASLRLSHIFDGADAAVSLYTENIKKVCEEECEKKLKQAAEEADRIIADANTQKEKIIEELTYYVKTISSRAVKMKEIADTSGTAKPIGAEKKEISENE